MATTTYSSPCNCRTCGTLGIAVKRPRGRRPGPVRIDPTALRRAREEAGLTLAQVAGSELTRQAVHLIETGKVRPSRASLELIARRLNRPVTAFLVAAPADGKATFPDRRIERLDDLCHRHEYAHALRLARLLLRSPESEGLTAYAHFYAGLALYRLGRRGEALNHLRKARRRFEISGNPWFAAEAMDWEAVVLYREDDLDTAVALAEEALRLYRSLEPRRPEIEARILEHIGTFLARRHAYDGARASFEAALRVMGTISDLEAMGRNYHGLAHCSYAVGDVRRAIELMEKAVSFYSAEHELRPAPAKDLLPPAQNDLGFFLMQQGQLDRAEAYFHMALDNIAAAGEDRFRTYVLLSIGQLRYRQGRLDEAQEVVHEAIHLSVALKQSVTEAEGHQQLAELHEAHGELEAADQRFERALGILQAAGLDDRLTECRRAYDKVLALRRGAVSGSEAPSGA